MKIFEYIAVQLKNFSFRTFAFIKVFFNYFFIYSENKQVKGPRAVLKIVSLLFICIFLWAFFFQVDQVIHAQGQVVANSKNQIIQSADGGVLTELNVQEGDVVKQGQVIAVLEKDRAFASYTESQSKVTALQMTVSRLEAELFGKNFTYTKAQLTDQPDLVSAQLNLFRQRRKSYLEQIQVLEESVRLADQELQMSLPLLKTEDVSKVEILRIQKTLNEAKGHLISVKNKYFQDVSAELNKAQEDLNSQEQVLADRRQLLEHTDIVAPVTGLVKSIRITTIGGVVRQGDEILQILPTESSLIIEAKIKPADMTFIKLDLPAKVKLDAYDYSIYGSMEGYVNYVSPDTIIEESRNGQQAFYKVKININEKNQSNTSANSLEIRPGMTVNIDIRTGKRSVMSYLMKPITKTLSQALTEK